jgi:hypothetical protein
MQRNLPRFGKGEDGLDRPADHVDQVRFAPIEAASKVAPLRHGPYDAA